MIRTRLLAVLALVTGVTIAGEPPAGERLANGTFDENLLAWTPLAAGQWSTFDAGADPASGSLRLRRSDGATDGAALVFEEQCVAAPSGATFAFAGRYFVTQPSIAGAAAAVVLTSHDGEDCTGPPFDRVTYGGAERGVWRDLIASSGADPLTTGPSGRSVLVQLAVEQAPQTRGVAEVFLDDLSLQGPRPAAPRFLAEQLANRGFAGSLVRWTLDEGEDRRARWVPADRAGSPASGAAELTSSGVGDDLVLPILRQCAPVEGESPVLVAGQYRVEAGIGEVILALTQFDDGRCAGLQVGPRRELRGDARGDWFTVTGPDTFPTHPSARSLELVLGLRKVIGVVADLRVIVDNLSLLAVDDRLLGTGFEADERR